MSKKSHHVVPAPQGGWIVKKGGATRASTNSFERKQDAIDRARKISSNQGTELVIHNKDGTIARKASHGRDVCPPRDRDTHK